MLSGSVTGETGKLLVRNGSKQFVGNVPYRLLGFLWGGGFSLVTVGLGMRRA